MGLESTPDIQLGKIFIVLWIAFILFIIISIIVVYFNAKNETSYCNNPENIINNSNKESSMSRSTKMFIAFLAITAFAVSTMNLTYKINYFKKKDVKPEKSLSSLNVLKLIKEQQSISPGETTTTNMSVGTTNTTSSLK